MLRARQLRLAVIPASSKAHRAPNTFWGPSTSLCSRRNAVGNLRKVSEKVTTLQAGNTFHASPAEAKAPCALSTRKHFVVPNNYILDRLTAWHTHMHTLYEVWAWSVTTSHTPLKPCEVTCVQSKVSLNSDPVADLIQAKEMRAGSKEGCPNKQ